jgi:hypothetical protein
VFVFDGLAVQPFEHADDPPIFNVLRTLSECGAECMVAPYKAWAQLGYLLQTSQIDMVFGSLEVKRMFALFLCLSLIHSRVFL